MIEQKQEKQEVKKLLSNSNQFNKLLSDPYQSKKISISQLINFMIGDHQFSQASCNQDKEVMQLNKILQYQLDNYAFSHQKQGMQKYCQIQTKHFSKQKEGKQMVIAYLCAHYGQNGSQIQIQSKSSNKSNLTLFSLPSGSFNRYRQVAQRFNIQDLKQLSTDQQFYQNKQNHLKVQFWYRDYLIHNFGLLQTDIHAIKFQLQASLNSYLIKFTWKTKVAHIVDHQIRKNQKLNITSSNLIKHIPLALQDFYCGIGDRGPQITSYLQIGNLPYYPFRFGYRYGIRTQIFGSDKKWIGGPDEQEAWPVGYVACATFEKQKQQIQSRKKVKDGQPFISEFAVNRPNQKIQQGTYVYARAQQAIKFSEQIQFKSSEQRYRIVFQCRLRPDSILVSPGNEQYWVVKNSQDIRLYGIILANQKQINNLKPFPQKLLFSWKNYVRHQKMINEQWK